MNIYTILGCIGSFILGVYSKFLSDKLTDRRRAREQSQREWAKFQEIEQQLPELIAAMRTDVRGDEGGLTRLVYPYNPRAINCSGRAFFYDPKVYQSVKAQLNVLNEAGFIINASSSSTTKYTLAPEFIQLLRKDKRG